MKRAFFYPLAAFILLLVLVACADTAAGDVPAEAAAIGDVNAGRQIFETGGNALVPCMTCHTLDGTELVGPSLQGIADRAASRTDLSAEDYLRQSITDPAAYLVDSYADVMNKEYGNKLSEEDIDNVVAFLLTQ